MTDFDFDFTQDRDAAQVVAHHLNPLPRSVVRRNATIVLDGSWWFDLDPSDQGLTEQWYLGHRFPDIAQWPSSIEEHLATAKHQQLASPDSDQVIAWYEREFALPDDWTQLHDQI